MGGLTPPGAYGKARRTYHVLFIIFHLPLRRDSNMRPDFPVTKDEVILGGIVFILRNISNIVFTSKNLLKKLLHIH